jgi:ATP-binding cassette subfamily B (MDR/TAP) protein 1
LAFCSSWELTLVLLASIPISLLFMTVVSKPLKPAIQAQRQCLAEASKLANASIAGIDLVKVFDGYESEMRQYLGAIDKVAAAYLVQARCNALQMGYLELWLVLLFMAGFWYGAVVVDKGVSPGAVFTTFYATFAAFQGVDALLPQFLVLSRGMVAGLSHGELASGVQRKESDDARGGYRPVKCFGEVDLAGVSSLRLVHMMAWTLD